MKTIVLDKIASVTKSVGLKREVRLSREIPCEEGIVIAVRILTDKSVYNQLELPSGRMAQIKRGDIVAGCLGHRGVGDSAPIERESFLQRQPLHTMPKWLSPRCLLYTSPSPRD